jgi:hypothetical protein
LFDYRFSNAYYGKESSSFSLVKYPKTINVFNNCILYASSFIDIPEVV